MNRTLKITIAIVSIIGFITVAYFTNFLTSDHAKASLTSIPTYEEVFFIPRGFKLYLTDENGFWLSAAIIYAYDSSTNKTAYFYPYKEREIVFNNEYRRAPEFYYTLYNERSNLPTTKIYIIPSSGDYLAKILMFDSPRNIHYVKECGYVGDRCQTVVEIFVTLEKNVKP